MNRGIVASATGMASCQQRLDVLSSNLAHLGVTGWKGSGVAFGDVIVSQLRAEGGEGSEIGTVSFEAPRGRQYISFTPGRIEETGNPLDLAIDGPDGMFGIQTPQGVRFVRDGSFRRASNGMLCDRHGYPVLDKDGRTIELPQGEIHVEPSGEVKAGERSLGEIAIFVGKFEPSSKGFTSSDARASDAVKLVPKALEASNVDAITAMVEMIQINRQFEMAQRSIATQDELTQKLIQSLQNAS